jgi:hypothetical protein
VTRADAARGDRRGRAGRVNPNWPHGSPPENSGAISECYSQRAALFPILLCSVVVSITGVCLGVFLDCRHGPQVFLVEAADDKSAEGAGDGGHGDVQDQSAAHPGAGVLRLE